MANFHITKAGTPLTTTPPTTPDTPTLWNDGGTLKVRDTVGTDLEFASGDPIHVRTVDAGGNVNQDDIVALGGGVGSETISQSFGGFDAKGVSMETQTSGNPTKFRTMWGVVDLSSPPAGMKGGDLVFHSGGAGGPLSLTSGGFGSEMGVAISATKILISKAFV